MLKALAAPLVLDEKKSADGRCGGDGRPGGALIEENKFPPPHTLSLLAYYNRVRRGRRGDQVHLVGGIHPLKPTGLVADDASSGIATGAAEWDGLRECGRHVLEQLNVGRESGVDALVNTLPVHAFASPLVSVGAAAATTGSSSAAPAPVMARLTTYASNS